MSSKIIDIAECVVLRPMHFFCFAEKSLVTRFCVSGVSNWMVGGAPDEVKNIESLIGALTFNSCRF